MRRHLPILVLALFLAAAAAPAQVTISVPDSSPTSGGGCNVIPFGSGTSTTWTPQTYVGRIPASFMDPANPAVDEIYFSPCTGGVWVAQDCQIALGHIPNPAPNPIQFPNVTTAVLGSFLDLTPVYDSTFQGPLTWVLIANTWTPMGFSGIGGTGFVWNGVDDVGFYITQNNVNGPTGGFNRTTTEPFRWYRYGSGAWQAPTSTGSGNAGLKIQFDCVPGGGGPLTLIANNTPSTGDLQLGVSNIPGAAIEGWTFLSADTVGPVGGGYAFGIWPDNLTLALLTLFPAASPGDPVHWTWPVASPLYPADNANFPPGSFPAFLYGTSWDFVVLAIEAGPVTASNVQRVNW